MRTSIKILFTLVVCCVVTFIIVDYRELCIVPDTVIEVQTIRRAIARPIISQLKRTLAKQLSLPVIYIITPTYPRPEQMAELTRLAQTLMHVPNIHWIVADDTSEKNIEVMDYLAYTEISHTYLVSPMPHKYKMLKKGRPRGVANRNAGLQWVKNNARDGVVYFADDDNTYDIRLFEEIRKTKKVSMFPVGLVTKFGLSTPIVKNGTFHAWYDGWIAKRKFPVDMAGFAVNVKHLMQIPSPTMPYRLSYEEDGFLKKLQVEPKDLEFLADGCTKVYVWHTKTKKNSPSSKKILEQKFDGTNLRILQKSMIIET